MYFKEKLAQKKPVGCFWLSLGSVPLAEFASDAGADTVVFDQQHGLWQRESLENAIGLIRKQISPIIRISACTRTDIGEALDAGAEGVIVPLIETSEQARQAVEWSQYPPLGTRSGGGIRPLRDFFAYKKLADKTTVTAVMIETCTGLENVSEIAQTRNLDMIFIGTGDLSLSLNADMGDPKMKNAIQSIKQASDSANISCGIFTTSLEDAILRRKQGFQLVVLGDDISANRFFFQDKITDFSNS